jgi:NTP pyrophosphatase (non-canonical NTP hydrolase)
MPEIRFMISAINTIPINELTKIVNLINRNNGWKVITKDEFQDPYKIPAILALIHSEVSKALESFRKDDFANFKEELADVIIRCLDCAGGLGIDIEDEIHSKLKKNSTRGHRHGNKKV